MEHLLSRQTSDRLLHLVRFFLSGEPVATAFLDALWKESDLCHDLAQCPLCDQECLMNLNRSAR